MHAAFVKVCHVFPTHGKPVTTAWMEPNAGEGRCSSLPGGGQPSVPSSVTAAFDHLQLHGGKAPWLSDDEGTRLNISCRLAVEPKPGASEVQT